MSNEELRSLGFGVLSEEEYQEYTKVDPEFSFDEPDNDLAQ